MGHGRDWLGEGSKMKTTYFHGDLARYTGKTMMIHGGLFYEIELLEGHLKGRFKVTQRAPTEAA
jgi:hypothetical protein